MKILLAAAAGKQGRFLIPKLSAAGHSVRAARVTPGKDEELRRLGADEVFVGDLSRLGVYIEALQGCDAVYHVGPTGIEFEKRSGYAMIEAAKRRGTRHLVFSSVYHTIIDIVQHRYKRDVEEKLFESGLNFTVLRPCDYMIANYHVDLPLKTGALPVFWDAQSGRRGSLIDLDDLTDVAAKILIEGDKHFFAVYELAGPDKLSAHEMSRILARVLGKQVLVLQISVADRIRSLFGVRESSPEQRHLTDMYNSIASWYSRFEFLGNPNVLEWLLGRKPTSFEQFVRRTLQQRASSTV